MNISKSFIKSMYSLLKIEVNYENENNNYHLHTVNIFAIQAP